MPVRKNEYIQELQLAIDKLGLANCLLIKLLNYEENKSFAGSNHDLLEELVKIVRKVCSSFTDSAIYITDHDNILVALPSLSDLLINNIALDIFRCGQLYVDNRNPDLYINCKITSIELSKVDNVAQSAYTALLHTLKNSNYYYTKCIPEINGLDIIRYNNNLLYSLKKALIKKQVRFDYQPIIDRKTGAIPYYECLLRVPGENNKMVSVGPFIREAERSGLIIVIDHMVLEMAVAELVAEPDISLSINLSNFGILDDCLLDAAETILKKHKVSDRLIIEITETSLNEDYNRTKLFIDRLHKLGCRFALDDFGSGFTSFRQIQNLPIDIIKIDGSYIRNVTENHYSQYFIQMLVKTSEELGIKTVAEFVENGAIAKFLIDIKIDALQGNFFSPASINKL